jgi:hypothetical protein
MPWRGCLLRIADDPKSSALIFIEWSEAAIFFPIARPPEGTAGMTLAGCSRPNGARLRRSIGIFLRPGWRRPARHHGQLAFSRPSDKAQGSLWLTILVERIHQHYKASAVHYIQCHVRGDVHIAIFAHEARDLIFGACSLPNGRRRGVIRQYHAQTQRWHERTPFALFPLDSDPGSGGSIVEEMNRRNRMFAVGENMRVHGDRRNRLSYLGFHDVRNRLITRACGRGARFMARGKAA